MALEASGGLRPSSDSGYYVGWRLCFRVYIGCEWPGFVILLPWLSSALTLTLNDSMPLIALPIRNTHILQGKRSKGALQGTSSSNTMAYWSVLQYFKNLYRLCLLYIYIYINTHTSF